MNNYSAEHKQNQRTTHLKSFYSYEYIKNKWTHTRANTHDAVVELWPRSSNQVWETRECTQTSACTLARTPLVLNTHREGNIGAAPIFVFSRLSRICPSPCRCSPQLPAAGVNNSCAERDALCCHPVRERERHRHTHSRAGGGGGRDQ